jgi:hypothetical protein
MAELLLLESEQLILACFAAILTEQIGFYLERTTQKANVVKIY